MSLPQAQPEPLLLRTWPEAQEASARFASPAATPPVRPEPDAVVTPVMSPPPAPLPTASQVTVPSVLTTRIAWPAGQVPETRCCSCDAEKPPTFAASVARMAYG